MGLPHHGTEGASHLDGVASLSVGQARHLQQDASSWQDAVVELAVHPWAAVAVLGAAHVYLAGVVHHVLAALSVVLHVHGVVWEIERREG